MGWRGTLRSINAATKAAARDAERRQKFEAKRRTTIDAAEDVDSWATYLRRVTSIHTDVAKEIDWQRIAAARKPNAPSPSRSETLRAEEALIHYAPGLLSRISGRAERTKGTMRASIEEAKSKDATVSAQQHRDFERAVEKWEKERQLANRLLDGDEGAVLEVVRGYETLSTDRNIGERIDFRLEGGQLVCEVLTHSDVIVPNFRRKQLASGKLSETKMPKGEFNELYQDYVASVALRVAGDMFQILPIDMCLVTCLARLLNTSTGHLEPTPILSVQFMRPTLQGLRMSSIDPSDALANFNHRMTFSRTKGFSRIEPLAPPVTPS